MEADARGERSRSLFRRLVRIALWIGAVALVLAVLDLLGVPVLAWVRDLFRKIADVPAWAIVAGVSLETAQTSLAALAWFGILRAALPGAAIPFRLVLASYAVAVALYVYLFVTVSGSFSIKLGFLSDHGPLLALIAVGAVVLVVLLARVFWERLAKFREQLLSGGAILRSPRRTLTDLFLPVLGSYLARLGIVAVFLGAYGIPVSFHNVATVTASNSISNSVSATPGGVGVTQAMNSAALSGEASAQSATAYSIGQQLIVSAWDVVLAVVLVSWAFGWSGGKQLVESSYADAKVKSREVRDSRRARKRGQTAD